jgi:hypothetical protein
MKNCDWGENYISQEDREITPIRENEARVVPGERKPEKYYYRPAKVLGEFMRLFTAVVIAIIITVVATAIITLFHK